MKKVLSSLLYLSILSIIAFGCSSTTEGETVVTDEGATITKSTVTVTMNEWDVKVDPNYKMGKHIKPGELTLTLKNEGNLNWENFYANYKQKNLSSSYSNMFNNGDARCG